MDVPYLAYLFLDAFSRREGQKLKTLYHVFNGKRTVSVLYNALRSDAASHTALFPRLRLSQLEALLHQFCGEGWLEQEGDSYTPTSEGLEEVDRFFEHHARLDNPNQMRFALVVNKFAQRSLFLAQVLSEWTYKNTDYLPINTSQEDQRYLKAFLKENRLMKGEMAAAFGKEWLQIIQESRISNPDLFLEQMEGHGVIRKTTRQTALRYGLSEAEVHIIWQLGWLAIIEWLERGDERFPLLSRIFIDLSQAGGLASGSAGETFLLMEQGLSPDRIVSARKLKPSTIHDHILEMAMVYLQFPFERFLSPKQLLFVEEVGKRQVDLDYTVIQESFPGLPFFESRLMQIMLEMRRIQWATHLIIP